MSFLGSIGSTLGTIGKDINKGVLDVATGGLAGKAGSLLGLGSSSPTANAASVNPFGPQQGTYQGALQALLSGSSGQSMLQMPGMQAALSQSTEAVKRNMNVQGLGASGNTLTGVTNAASGLATTAQNNLYNVLSQLSGANSFNPMAIAGLQGQQAQMQGQTLSGVGSLLATVAKL